MTGTRSTGRSPLRVIRGRSTATGTAASRTVSRAAAGRATGFGGKPVRSFLRLSPEEPDVFFWPG
ncbi:hypothetical protein HB770_01820 [Rhizobium leguminosarum bv. viciae]|uniref:Uncharacterized protein n=1 Tax=Rhizobium leguminosarum bv. viciae TaxID=387 RepID=A0A7G6RH05_RHILV|nr:hypothetical protein HB770_01820 [Rhizobium leguminosarum bv. viciae]